MCPTKFASCLVTIYTLWDNQSKILFHLSYKWTNHIMHPDLDHWNSTFGLDFGNVIAIVLWCKNPSTSMSCLLCLMLWCKDLLTSITKLAKSKRNENKDFWTLKPGMCEFSVPLLFLFFFSRCIIAHWLKETQPETDPMFALYLDSPLLLLELANDALVLANKMTDFRKPLHAKYPCFILG